MASGPASTQRDARQNWTSAYPFEITNGGLGVGIDASTTSARAALVGLGNVLELNNEQNAVDMLFAWGGSDVEATTSHYLVGAGVSKIVSIPEETASAITHVAVRTVSGSGRALIYRGHGN